MDVSDSRESDAAILSAEEVQCWSSVKEDPTDFQSWIKLLQLVEQKASSPTPTPPLSSQDDRFLPAPWGYNVAFSVKLCEL